MFLYKLNMTNNDVDIMEIIKSINEKLKGIKYFLNVSLFNRKNF